MPTSIITTEDLKEFKEELLSDIKVLLEEKNGRVYSRWLKSADVMELLKISPGTLQNLRVNGTLPYTKVGGLIFYNEKEINEIMENNRIQNL